MGNHESTTESWCRWLYATPRDRLWGLTLSGVGVTRVVAGEEFFMGDEGLVRPHYGFMYLVEGDGVYRSREVGEMALKAGDAFVFLPGVWHRYRPSLETGWLEYWVTFDGSLPNRLVEKGLLSADAPVLHFSHGSHIGAVFAELLDAVLGQPPCSNPELAAIVYRMLAAAVSDAKTRCTGVAVASGILKAKYFLDENTHRTVDMAELARCLSMSRRQLYYEFKQVTGEAPRAYHMHVRVTEAKALLENADLMVKEVAGALGFHDQYHFSKVFKRICGISPEEWRKSRLG